MLKKQNNQMANKVTLSAKSEEVLAAAAAAKVSAMNDQFVPSYSLEPGHKYIIIDDMLIVTPRTTKVKGADGVEKEVNFMEMYVADITDEKNPVFLRISCGQIYNQFKVLETGKREFKMLNLRDLAKGESTTPSLKMLVSALSINDIILTPEDEEVDCEIFGSDHKMITFFNGSHETNKEIRTQFNKWLAK